MKTRNDYRFILAPWEHRGAQFDARPDLVATAKVGGIEQEFLLKVRANRVFFRLAEDETRVWGTTNEIEAGGNVVSFWQSEVELGCIARLFQRMTHINAIWDSTVMAVLVSNDGNALLCEWCSDVWWQGKPSSQLEKFARSRRDVNLWHSAWQPSLRQLMARNHASIRDRLMPVAEREATRRRWVCGSEKELNRLLRLFLTVHAPILNRNSSHHKTILFNFRGSWAGQNASLSVSQAHSFKQLPMLDVFVEYNQTWGADWQMWVHKSGEERRGDWRLVSDGQILSFSQVEPSFHEQLEARLELREWLRGKVSAEQMESWLQT